jgi:hypothetical protein
MERVFVAVSDAQRLSGKDAIEWSMLRGEEPIVCQSEQRRPTSALPSQRPDLRPARLLYCFAHSQDRVVETGRRIHPFLMRGRFSPQGRRPVRPGESHRHSLRVTG